MPPVWLSAALREVRGRAALPRAFVFGARFCGCAICTGGATLVATLELWLPGRTEALLTPPDALSMVPSDSSSLTARRPPRLPMLLPGSEKPPSSLIIVPGREAVPVALRMRACDLMRRMMRCISTASSANSLPAVPPRPLLRRPSMVVRTFISRLRCIAIRFLNVSSRTRYTSGSRYMPAFMPAASSCVSTREDLL